jgi:hypothetical protein
MSKPQSAVIVIRRKPRGMEAAGFTYSGIDESYLTTVNLMVALWSEDEADMK